MKQKFFTFVLQVLVYRIASRLCQHGILSTKGWTATAKHLKTLWQRVAETYPICENPLSISARRSLAPPQKSRQNHRSYVWTEALPGMVFVSAQELSGVEHSLRTCLLGGGGPQVGEVTCGGSSHLSCKRDQIKVRQACYPTYYQGFPTSMHVNRP